MTTMATDRLATSTTPRWIPFWLGLAGIYNLTWGMAAVLWPNVLFRWAGIDPPNYPELWQCIGMIVGVYGIGYAIAATDPVRHWPIVLVGLLGKVFGPIGFLQAAVAGKLPWRFGTTLLFNDLMWWIPFGAILVYVVRVSRRSPDSR